MEDTSLIIRRCKRSNDVKLNLSNRGLFSFPSDLFNLVQLQHLQLNGNKITIIDPKIIQLQHLKILDLQNNSLMELPQELANLPELETLILTGNPLLKQFEQLTKSENQNGLQLKQVLKQCFNLNIQSKINYNDDNKEEQKQNKFKQQQKDKILQQQQLINQTSSYGSVMEVDANEYEIGEIISQGGFSIVHRATLRGTEVALKKIFNPNITTELMNEIENEINMLALIRHPNIVQLMAVTTKPPNLYIATEYVQKGSLFQLLHKSRTTVSEPLRLRIATQICRVLLYLHLSGIVHRDIKSHNILLDENFKVKLCDFGLARKISEINVGSMQFSGTPAYMAPEQFQKRAYDKSVDNFAFGTLLWELFAREVPYEGLDPQDIAAKVIKGEVLNMKNLPKSISQLVNDLRQIEPQKRSSMESVLQVLDKLSL